MREKLIIPSPVYRKLISFLSKKNETYADISTEEDLAAVKNDILVAKNHEVEPSEFSTSK